MRITYLVLFLIEIVHCKISIDIISTGIDGNVTITSSNIEVKLIDHEIVKQFKIEDWDLKAAVKKHYGRKPSSLYLKSPTPWGDLYRTYKWEQISKVISVKCTRIKNSKNQPEVLLTHNFENAFNETVKVNTGLTLAVDNRLTTSWSRNNEIEVSQEIQYDVNVVIGKLSGNTGFSYTSTWGKSEEISKSVTIGTSTNVETELKPGQAATAELSATQGFLEIEVTYISKLRGNLAVNFRKPYKEHHFWGPPIADVMKSGGISNEIKTDETIRIGYYTDASLRVYDSKTKQPL